MCSHKSEGISSIRQSLLNTFCVPAYMAILIPCTCVHGQFNSVYMCTSRALCTRYMTTLIPCTSVHWPFFSVYQCTRLCLCTMYIANLILCTSVLMPPFHVPSTICFLIYEGKFFFALRAFKHVINLCHA